MTDLKKKYSKNMADEILPTPNTPVVENQTNAQRSLALLDDAIALADPSIQVEIKYVEERLNFLLARHTVAADYAIMRAALKCSIDKGQ